MSYRLRATVIAMVVLALSAAIAMVVWPHYELPIGIAIACVAPAVAVSIDERYR